MPELPVDMQYGHCLRPTFTRKLAHTLLDRRRSINLIGAPGSAKRLLQDLRECWLPDTLVLPIDLRTHEQSFSGFLAALGQQLPSKSGQAPRELGLLVRKLDQSGKRVLLLFDNFDALLDNPDIDPAFGIGFHNHLNSIKNHPRMALLCVTAKPLQDYAVIVKGRPHGTSSLDLEPWPLPALSRWELRHEIARQQPGLDVDTAAMLAEAVHGRENSWDLLDFLLAQWANREDVHLELEQRVGNWVKQFDKSQDGKANTGALYRTLRTCRAWWAAAGLPSPKRLFAALGGWRSGLGRPADRHSKNAGEDEKP